MKYTITDHENLIDSLKKQSREGQTSESIELIPRRPATVGSERASRNKARKAESALNTFRNSLRRITNGDSPFSILACICSLPDSLENLPEGCNKDDFFDVFLWLLSDTGFLFDEVRPAARGQYPVEDLYAVLDEKNMALDDARQLESTIISSVLSAFHDKYRHPTDHGDDVPSILRKLGNLTGEKDWFRRCLLQTFSTKRSSANFSKEELASNWINNSNLSAAQLDIKFFRKASDGSIVSQQEAEDDPSIEFERNRKGTITYALRYAIGELAEICDETAARYFEAIGKLSTAAAISEDAYSRYHEQCTARKSLVWAFDALNNSLPQSARKNLLDLYASPNASPDEDDYSKESKSKHEYFYFHHFEELSGFNITRKHCQQLARICYRYFFAEKSIDRIKNTGYAFSAKRIIDFSLCGAFAFKGTDAAFPISPAPAITYWLLKRYRSSFLKTGYVFEKLRIDTLFQPLSKPSNPEVIVEDIELFSDLCDFYANIYGKRCTVEVKGVWKAVFLVYSGYQELYLNSELLQKVSQTVSFPHAFYYDRICNCLSANKVSLIHNPVSRNKMAENPLMYERFVDPKCWDKMLYESSGYLYFRQLLDEDCSKNKNPWVNRFCTYLSSPYTHNDILQFLDKCIHGLIIETNATVCESYDFYSLAKQLKLEKIFVDNTVLMRDPLLQCCAVLEYTLRSILEERCSQWFYKWMVIFVNQF